jgi:hypothetical protein
MKPLHVIAKNEERRQVWGWAAISSVNDQMYIDDQRDIIPIDVLERSVAAYMKRSRAVGDMHTTVGRGELIGSIVMSKALQRALNIDCGVEGWLVCVELDEPLWQAFKRGERPGLSIAGSATKTPLNKWKAKARGGQS